MKETTKRRKKATGGMKAIYGRDIMMDWLYRIISNGKQGFDALMMSIGRMIAEVIMYIEREETAGPDYAPISPAIRKWASQPGSIYVGDQKLQVEHPRLRGPHGEISLESYRQLKEPGRFSEELLMKVLRGISCQKYGETVVEAAQTFGVSASSISQHIIAATARQLKEFKERSLSAFEPFAIFLDTIHRGGEAFVVGLGIDRTGGKKALGFWEGATENHELCEELLADMERRGLTLSRKIIWITEGCRGQHQAISKQRDDAALAGICSSLQ